MAGFSDEVMQVIRAAAPTVGGILGSAIPIPGVGTALGAAAANMAVDALGKALKVPPTPEAINTKIEEELAVVKGGGQGALLREADLHAKLNSAELVALTKINADLEISKLKVELADVQQARQVFTATKDYTQKAVGLVIVGAFLVMLAWAMYRVIPPENREFVTLLIGQLSGAFITVVAFFYGSSQGSKRNADTVRNVALNK